MSKNNKYLKSGGLNPHWVEEQWYEKQLERDLEYERLSQQQSYEIAERYKNNEYQRPPRRSANVNNIQILEDQFKFLKDHSNSKEDLELAKFIIENQ